MVYYTLFLLYFLGKREDPLNPEYATPARFNIFVMSMQGTDYVLKKIPDIYNRHTIFINQIIETKELPRYYYFELYRRNYNVNFFMDLPAAMEYFVNALNNFYTLPDLPKLVVGNHATLVRSEDYRTCIVMSDIIQHGSSIKPPMILSGLKTDYPFPRPPNTRYTLKTQRDDTEIEDDMDEMDAIQPGLKRLKI